MKPRPPLQHHAFQRLQQLVALTDRAPKPTTAFRPLCAPRRAFRATLQTGFRPLVKDIAPLLARAINAKDDVLPTLTARTASIATFGRLESMYLFRGAARTPRPTWLCRPTRVDFVPLQQYHQAARQQAPLCGTTFATAMQTRHQVRL